MKKKEPNCKNCLDRPLFGCVACPRPPSAAELQEKLDEIDKEIDMGFQITEVSFAKQCRKRFDTLLRIRGIIHRGKK
ncbi:MAG: hypothetical protein V3V14_10480 [Saprospiraceae bacterium]